MNSLPLSWSIKNDGENSSKFVKIGKVKWISLNEININKYENSLNLIRDSKNEIIIRGCNSEIKEALCSNNFYFVKSGMEAVLDTKSNHFEKKSLINIVKRGNKAGKIYKLAFSFVNRNKLIEFQKSSIHSNEPQLKNLFQDNFNENHFLYVSQNQNGEWLGAILVSVNIPDKFHTELILRKMETPIGVMEALIHKIFTDTKNMNISKLSLGEVPFYSDNNRDTNFKSSLLFIMGGFLNFAYNSKGLFNFKNKFQPIWKNTFICISAKVKIKHLVFLFIQSNLYKLVIYKSLKFLTKTNILEKIITKNIFINSQLDFNKT